VRRRQENRQENAVAALIIPFTAPAALGGARQG
jgi:hypothetical protein